MALPALLLVLLVSKLPSTTNVPTTTFQTSPEFESYKPRPATTAIATAIAATTTPPPLPAWMVGDDACGYGGCEHASVSLTAAAEAAVSSIKVQPQALATGLRAALSTAVHRLSSFWRLQDGAGRLAAPATQADPAAAAALKATTTPASYPLLAGGLRVCLPLDAAAAPLDGTHAACLWSAAASSGREATCLPDVLCIAEASNQRTVASSGAVTFFYKLSIVTLRQQLAALTTALNGRAHALATLLSACRLEWISPAACMAAGRGYARSLTTLPSGVASSTAAAQTAVQQHLTAALAATRAGIDRASSHATTAPAVVHTALATMHTHCQRQAASAAGQLTARASAVAGSISRSLQHLTAALGRALGACAAAWEAASSRDIFYAFIAWLSLFVLLVLLLVVPLVVLDITEPCDAHKEQWYKVPAARDTPSRLLDASGSGSVSDSGVAATVLAEVAPAAVHADKPPAPHLQAGTAPVSHPIQLLSSHPIQLDGDEQAGTTLASHPIRLCESHPIELDSDDDELEWA